MTPAIRAVTSADLPALFAYLGEQLTENGRHGNPLFQPMAPTSDPAVPPAMKARFTNGLATPVGEPGWRRAWIAVGAHGEIAGHIDLRARPDAEASHRVLLGMGVHRDHRRAGLGMRLIGTARGWAGAQPGFDWIDLDRVGVWGHSGGGYATVDAMFTYPDFYKVGISESGNHDNRNYEDDWAEKWQGLEVVDKDGDSNYDDQANQNRAENLKGKLLLAHGMMDDNVPPQNTLLVVDALIKANKDFDLLLFPNARHGFGQDSNYMTRRRWDFFVEHLLGGTPPAGYELGAD